jgi:hypothetical protein
VKSERSVTSGREDDFFAELLAIEPDDVVTLIGDAANFLRIKRTARAPRAEPDTGVLRRLSEEIRDFAGWYAACGIEEPATAECVADLERLRVALDDALNSKARGEQLLSAYA